MYAFGAFWRNIFQVCVSLILYVAQNVIKPSLLICSNNDAAYLGNLRVRNKSLSTDSLDFGKKNHGRVYVYHNTIRFQLKSDFIQAL